MKPCQLYRTLALLWLDDPRRLPAFIEKHVRHCPACREHLERESSFAQELQTAAAAEREPLPQFLPSRLQSRLRSAGAGGEITSAQSALWRRIAWAGAGVVGVFLVWIAFSPWSQPPEASATVASPGTVPDPTALVQTLVPRAGESLEEWSQLLEQPLTREISSALEDSRGVLIALVQNFVPEPNVAAVTERANGLFPELAGPVTAQP
jgi:hypothetical protein